MNKVEQFRKRRAIRLQFRGDSEDRLDIAEWKEELHKRDKSGRFTSKGGENKGGAVKDTPRESESANKNATQSKSIPSGKQQSKVTGAKSGVNKGKDLGGGTSKSTVKHSAAERAGVPSNEKKINHFTIGRPISSRHMDTTRASASDCIAEVDKSGNLYPNSSRGYTTPDGKFTEERQAIHDGYTKKKLNGLIPQPQGERVCTILGGGPASGKSFLSKKRQAELPKKSSCIIDPDDAKEAIPGYAERAEQSPEAASWAHEESSAMSKAYFEDALDAGVNPIYDGTGDGSEKSLMKKINQARAKGQRVEGAYMTIDIDEAIKRNEQRYRDGQRDYEHAKKMGWKTIDGKPDGKPARPPRYVKPEDVRKIHSSVTDCAVACAPEFDHFELWDNSGAQGEEHVIATGGGGKPITAVPGHEAELRAFLDKGKYRDDYSINEKGEVVSRRKK